ncbi:Selenocysteine-specific elongation factor [Planctomycetes bacterium Poly30]|uniref:Selenocysteine-specific elongation factor n=1 Tax=Saltatorellus ferox TaxID=2528018 RepID=A0A518ERX9_9BACT|nr:Selenocysteine-specific elongation factor [Planctomycetes bacterium Poly30]
MEIQPIVIGTAGHIDHGKSTLVQALTGTDPDRWAEEKARGMTIDLGFARMDLPDGRRVGIVDVPGHERFIRNMVAGATGIDLVILVVAADDGVMPQTREHLSIMQMLGVKRGFVALTKVDIVDPDMADLAEEDVRETVEGTFLEGAPIVHVSAIQGTGMEELKGLLMSMAAEAEPRQAEGVFRMPVQRVFSARGFGTILTGIPVSGVLSVGEMVEVLPSGQRGKVRGIQAYHESSDTARAGHSTALNISDIDHHEVHRGDVVATPGFFKPQSMVGAQLLALEGLPLPIVDRMQVRVHTGTTDAIGEMVLLDAEELAGGQEGLVQFRMETPLVCAPGDRFVLRLASPAMTLGGGVILEESRYRLKRFKTFIIDELQRQAASLGSTAALLEALLVRSPERWASLEDMALGIKRPRQETEELLRELQSEGKVADLGKSKWIHAETLDLCLTELNESLAGWFAEHPLRGRMDIRDLRARLKLDPALIGVLLDREAAEGRVVLSTGGFVALAGREVTLDPEVAKLRDGVLAALREARFQPPSPGELATALGVPRPSVDTVLKLGVDEGQVTHIGAELYLSGEVVEEARRAVIANCQVHGHLEIPDLRDALGTTRKFLIPILEQFDTEGLTLRQAGRRVLKKK